MALGVLSGVNPRRLRSMDKLFDLMTMGVKQQLLIGTSHDSLAQARSLTPAL